LPQARLRSPEII
jgi:hypothetical protein